MARANILLNFVPNLAGLKAQDAATQQSAARMGQLRAATAAAQTAIATLGVGVGLFALVRLLRESADLYKVQAQAVAQVDQAIKSTGRSSSITGQELQRLASQIQSVGTFGDEAILSMQSILLTFRNLGTETLPRATQAVVDMSVRMGTDLQSAALQVGKALDDPARRVAELSRAGITFSKSQTEMIKKMAETGHLAEAQAMILEELEKQFGGADVAARKAAGGAEAFGKVVGDTKEVIGSLFVPALNNAIEALLRFREASRLAAEQDRQSLRGFLELLIPLLESASPQVKALSQLLVLLKKAGAETGETLVGVTPRFSELGVQSDLAADGLDKATEALFENIEALRKQREELEKIQARHILETYRDRLKEIAEVARQAGMAIEGMATLPSGAEGGLLQPIDTSDLDRRVREIVTELGGGVKEVSAIFWEEMKRGVRNWIEFFTRAWQQALDSALRAVFAKLSGEDVSLQEAFGDIGAQFGRKAGEVLTSEMGPIAQVFGTLAGEALGRVLGDVVGKLLDDLFGSSPGVTGQVAIGAGGATAMNFGADLQGWADQFNAFIQQIQLLTGSTLQIMNQVVVQLFEDGGVLVNLMDQAGNILRTEVFGNIQDAMNFAITEVLRMAELGDDMALAFKELIASATDINKLMEDLLFVVGLGRQLQGMGGPVNQARAAILNTLFGFEQLRAQIHSLGLTAEAAAPLLEAVTRAENQRIRALRSDVLLELARMARQFGVSSRFVVRVQRMQVRVQFAILRAQLQLLGLWTRYEGLWRNLRALAMEAARATGEVTRNMQSTAVATTTLTGALQGVAGAIESVGISGGDLWRGVIRSIREFRKELQLSEFAPGTRGDKARMALQRFRELLQRTLAGDFSAAQLLQGAAQQALQLGQGAFGNATGQFRSIFDEIMRGLGIVSGLAGGKPASQLQLEATQNQTALMQSQAMRAERQRDANTQQVVSMLQRIDNRLATRPVGT